MTCHGNCESHCCYFRGVVCPFLEENTVPGRRWACGLFRELGDWNSVIADRRYKNIVVSLWNTIPECRGKNFTCENYPNGLPEVKVNQIDCGWYKENDGNSN